MAARHALRESAGRVSSASQCESILGSASGEIRLHRKIGFGKVDRIFQVNGGDIHRINFIVAEGRKEAGRSTNSRVRPHPLRRSGRLSGSVRRSILRRGHCFMYISAECGGIRTVPVPSRTTRSGVMPSWLLYDPPDS